MKKVFPLLLAGAVVLAGGSQCPSTALKLKSCKTALDCGKYHTCERNSGTCKCVDSRACGDGEFCNGVGACQAQAGCQDNSDCELLQSGVPLRCDVRSGQCQPAELCFDHSHCALGMVCDFLTNRCVAGCLDEADCVLGQGCIKSVTAPDALGVCTVGACTADVACPPANRCDLTTHRCVVDTHGPFCGACQSFNPLDPQCGDPANYCLVDVGDPARRAHYCGVDCSQQQGCPNGFECKDVIIVGPPATPACTSEACNNGVCSVSGTACTSALECPLGPPGGDCHRAHEGVCAGTLDHVCHQDGDCGGSVGSCRFSQCLLRERSAYGFCSCVVDSDCPADDCRNADLTDPGNPVAGRCFLSGHECYGPEECSVIACVSGGCLIGRNCKPGQDRRCVDLQVNVNP